MEDELVLGRPDALPLLQQAAALLDSNFDVVSLEHHPIRPDSDVTLLQPGGQVAKNPLNLEAENGWRFLDLARSISKVTEAAAEVGSAAAQDTLDLLHPNCVRAWWGSGASVWSRQGARRYLAAFKERPDLPADGLWPTMFHLYPDLTVYTTVVSALSQSRYRLSSDNRERSVEAGVMVLDATLARDVGRMREAFFLLKELPDWKESSFFAAGLLQHTVKAEQGNDLAEPEEIVRRVFEGWARGHLLEVVQVLIMLEDFRLARLLMELYQSKDTHIDGEVDPLVDDEYIYKDGKDTSNGLSETAHPLSSNWGRDTRDRDFNS
eukprot:g57033.t1